MMDDPTRQSPATGPDDAISLPEATVFRDMLATRWIGYALHAAAKLNLADELSAGPRSAAVLADVVGADPSALQRLLRALATIGVVTQTDDSYELTPIGALLRVDSPQRLRDQVLLTGGERSLRAWSRLVECVQTGSAATAILDGVEDPFAWFADRPEEQARFDAAMAEGTRQVADALAGTYDFSGITTIVDVGGGYGTLLTPILHAHPDMVGTVFDRPHCRSGAEKVIGDSRLTARYRFVGGDFFQDQLPAAADAYVLKSVIHDWDDDRSVTIFRRCLQAMQDTSRLLLIEVVLPPRLESVPEHRRMVWADLNMLVSTGGRERTESEYRMLIAAAGLRISRIISIDTPALMSVVEIVPA